MAERLNRTLQDKCRTMLIAAKLPRYLWGEVLEAANMLRNLTPVSNMACTPSQKTFGKSGPVKNRIFLIYELLAAKLSPKSTRNKFEPVAYRGVLVNYSINSNCCRVWDPTGTKVYNVDFR